MALVDPVGLGLTSIDQTAGIALAAACSTSAPGNPDSAMATTRDTTSKVRTFGMGPSLRSTPHTRTTTRASGSRYLGCDRNAPWPTATTDERRCLGANRCRRRCRGQSRVIRSVHVKVERVRYRVGCRPCPDGSWSTSRPPREPGLPLVVLGDARLHPGGPAHRGGHPVPGLRAHPFLVPGRSREPGPAGPPGARLAHRWLGGRRRRPQDSHGRLDRAPRPHERGAGPERAGRRLHRFSPSTW